MSLKGKVIVVLAFFTLALGALQWMLLAPTFFLELAGLKSDDEVIRHLASVPALDLGLALGFDYLFALSYAAFGAALLLVGGSDSRMPRPAQIVCVVGLVALIAGAMVDVAENIFIALVASGKHREFAGMVRNLQPFKLTLTVVPILLGMGMVVAGWQQRRTA